MLDSCDHMRGEGSLQSIIKQLNLAFVTIDNLSYFSQKIIILNIVLFLFFCFLLNNKSKQV